ncbi:MAG TPA: hypothetical protein EYP57_03465 [Thermodesulfobacteriaceae bacterium]|nr:hypothetical protein [Thermodesulfobacteriaceae bacterium]
MHYPAIRRRPGRVIPGRHDFGPWRMTPDYSVREFAEDVKRRRHRRTLVLQTCDNAADLVQSRYPCGFK